MTDRDVLKRASEALRDATEPSAEELARLRSRVISRGKVAPLRPSSKRKSLRWILPLAAAFITASALAATPGAFDGMLAAVERYLDVELFGRAHEAAHTPPARPAHAKRAQDVLSPSPLASVTPEPDPVPLSLPDPTDANLPVPMPVPDSTSPTRPRATRPPPRTVEARASAREQNEEARASARRQNEEAPVQRVTSASPEPPTTAGPSRDLALYQKAHALHFRERRYDEALFAWEEYLGLTPAPTFALEARYNRALCLLRLGHYEEARAALVPFAEGRYANAYRRDEAIRFIQALDKRR